MKINALAHRGYPGKFPENTIKGFDESYKLGFSHIEIDVQLSKDGIPVIMHDKDIDRTANGSGKVRDYTLKELKQFKVADAEEIPTLEEALLFAKGKGKVAVELKQFGDYYEGLEEATLEVIKSTNMMDEVYANSFDHFSIIKMRELSEEIELGFTLSGPTPAILPLMQEFNIKYLSLLVDYLTDKYVSMCEEAGITLVVWPVDTEEQFIKALRYESVLSTTNELEEYKRLIEKYRSKG